MKCTSSLWFVWVVLTGCSAITPLDQLSLPPSRFIQGHVGKMDQGFFWLKHDQISIRVRCKACHKRGISSGERISVEGNLMAGKEKTFDAYVITNASGEQIVIQSPAAHLGFVIRSEGPYSN